MEKEILVNGRKIVYFEEGEGFPLLIIHGWGVHEAPIDFLNFQKIIAQRGFRVYLPYLPGFGRSDKPSRDWKMEDYINCIFSFVKKLGIENFYLLGHSFGGALAIRMTYTSPEKVKALVLLSPAIIGPKLTFFELIRASAFYLFLNGLSVGYILLHPLVFVLRRIWQTGKRISKLYIVFEQIKKLRRFYLVDKMARIVIKLSKGEDTALLLRQIKHPVLVIWGEKDVYNPLHLASAIGHLIHHSLRILPRVGHSPQRDCPEKLADLITDFLANSGHKV